MFSLTTLGWLSSDLSHWSVSGYPRINIFFLLAVFRQGSEAILPEGSTVHSISYKPTGLVTSPLPAPGHPPCVPSLVKFSYPKTSFFFSPERRVGFFPVDLHFTISCHFPQQQHSLFVAMHLQLCTSDTAMWNSMLWPCNLHVNHATFLHLYIHSYINYIHFQVLHSCFPQVKNYTFWTDCRPNSRSTKQNPAE